MLDIWMCGGAALDRLGYPLYVEIAFAEGATVKDIRDFLAAIQPHDAAFLDCVKRLGKPSLPVFIPAEIAHPGGSFFSGLIPRPHRAKALVVAFYGTVNPRCCSHCIRSFTKSISATREHVLSPFSECVSFPPYFQGSCANCLWQSNGGCEWQTVTAYNRLGPVDQMLRGKSLDASLKPKNPDRSTGILHEESAPRITKNWPFDEGAARADASAARSQR